MTKGAQSREGFSGLNFKGLNIKKQIKIVKIGVIFLVLRHVNIALQRGLIHGGVCQEIFMEQGNSELRALN